MRIAIAGEISRIGGGQMYMKELINAVSHSNDITVISDPATDPLSILGSTEQVLPVNYNYSEDTSYFTIFKNVTKLKSQLKKIDRRNFDLIINNHPNIFLLRGDINILHGFSFLDFILDENGNITNLPLSGIIRLLGIYKIFKNANFLANSKYTMDISSNLFKKLHLDANLMGVLYPTFSSSFEQTKLNNGIILVQRINRKKNLTSILDIAKKIEDRVIIAGAVNPGDEEYLKEIKNNKPDNVVIYPNPTENEKTELFLKSSIYIHMNRKEHFGISVVEAMSHGLIPIVPKSGGPWIDIVESGKYGYGYSDFEDIPNLICTAKKLKKNDRMSVTNSTQRFSKEGFRNTLYKYIEMINSS